MRKAEHQIKEIINKAKPNRRASLLGLLDKKLTKIQLDRKTGNLAKLKFQEKNIFIYVYKYVYMYYI